VGRELGSSRGRDKGEVGREVTRISIVDWAVVGS